MFSINVYNDKLLYPSWLNVLLSYLLFFIINNYYFYICIALYINANKSPYLSGLYLNHHFLTLLYIFLLAFPLNLLISVILHLFAFHSTLNFSHKLHLSSSIYSILFTEFLSFWFISFLCFSYQRFCFRHFSFSSSSV